MWPDTAAARTVIGIGELAVGQGAGVIITHALGSCIGVAIWDAHSRVGGLLHAQLPSAAMAPERARERPALYVDAGIAALFHAAYARGADKKRLRVVVAGGANVTGAEHDLLNVSRRNVVIMRKAFWQNGVLIAAEDTGGDRPRTMALDLATGTVAMESLGNRYEL